MKLKSPLDVCQILQKCQKEVHQDVRIVGAQDSSVSTSRLLLAVLCPQLARLLDKGVIRDSRGGGSGHPDAGL